MNNPYSNATLALPFSNYTSIDIESNYPYKYKIPTI